MVTPGTGIGGGSPTDARTWASTGSPGDRSLRRRRRWPTVPVRSSRLLGALCPGSGLGWLGRQTALAGVPSRGRSRWRRGGSRRARGGGGTQNDPDALAVIDRYGRWVALGLANLTNTFDPRCSCSAAGWRPTLTSTCRGLAGSVSCSTPRPAPHPELVRSWANFPPSAPHCPLCTDLPQRVSGAERGQRWPLS